MSLATLEPVLSADWSKVLNLLGPLAEYVPQPLEGEPSKHGMSLQVCPFGQTEITCRVYFDYFRGFYLYEIWAYEREESFPPCFWIHRRRFLTPQAALQLARSQDESND